MIWKEEEDLMQFRGEFDFLSNFYIQPIFWSGREWATAEHAYQAAKTLNPEEIEQIASASTPGKAKRLGRVKEDGGIVTLRSDWKEVRVGIMHSILEAKFSVPELKTKLLGTDGLKLVEGNYWHDNFFGSCYCQRCGYNGKNKLGELLMQIRADKILFD